MSAFTLIILLFYWPSGQSIQLVLQKIWPLWGQEFWLTKSFDFASFDYYALASNNLICLQTEDWNRHRIGLPEHCASDVKSFIRNILLIEETLF